MKGEPTPTYDLAEVQRKMRAGEYRVTTSARDAAALLGFQESDIERCIASLRRMDFYKSMEAERAPGLWQDVYRPTFEGVALYVKVQIAVRGNAVVISFKEK